MIEYKEYFEGYFVRSTGWIQDASDFNNLYNFVNAFNKDSPHQIIIAEKLNRLIQNDELKAKLLKLLKNENILLSYQEIVGTSPRGNKSRKTSTVCNSIGQAALKGQTRDFSGDWPTDNFLRWALSLQFIEQNSSDGKFSITPTGLKFSNETDGNSRKVIIYKQLLMYPPAVRVLELLNATGIMNKFDIGEKLGLIGEKGFTSITSSLFLELSFSSDNNERKKLKSDLEGSADKYARQICAWLQKLNLVQNEVMLYKNSNDTLKIKGYSITPKGKEFIRKASSVKKYVPFGMLSMELKNKEYHCKRRALILASIEGTSKKISEIRKDLYNDSSLKEDLSRMNLKITDNEIQNDLKSFVNIGLNIEQNNGEFKLIDKVSGLFIPKNIVIETHTKIQLIKEKLINDLQNIDFDLLNLIDYSYGKTSSRYFEIYVAKVLKVIFNKVRLLGGASKPDVVASNDEFTMIIDAKAYKNGFALPINEQDKMVRYIEEYKNTTGIWIGNIIDEEMYNTIDNLVYQFISSSFNNIEGKLTSIKNRTSIDGGAMSAEALLRVADLYMSTNSIEKENFIGHHFI